MSSLECVYALIRGPTCERRHEEQSVGTKGVFVKSMVGHREEARPATTGSGPDCLKLGS